MLLSWWITAVTLPALAVLLSATAVILHIRVLGSVSKVNRELLEYKTAVEQLDTRITREVKSRAGLQRAAEAADERSLMQTAQDTLQHNAAVAPPRARPSRIYRR